jgi:ankyrin repeat protein
LVELLVVHHNADVNRADEDGETALHLTLHKLNNLSQADVVAGSRPDDAHTTVINGLLQSLPSGSSVWLAVACLLVRKGASISALNARGVSPLQAVNDLSVVQVLLFFVLIVNIFSYFYTAPSSKLPWSPISSCYIS